MGRSQPTCFAALSHLICAFSFDSAGLVSDEAFAENQGRNVLICSTAFTCRYKNRLKPNWHALDSQIKCNIDVFEEGFGRRFETAEGF
jgi:hypothetical protein